MGEFGQDPAVHRAFDPGIVDLARRAALIHLGKAGRIPELGGEVAIAFDGLFGEPDVAPLPGHAAHREAQRVGTVFVDQFQRVHGIALGLGHFLALLVEHERVDVDVLERNFPHEFEAHHHHPGDPEEDDVERGNKRRGREEGVEIDRLVRPALCGKRPEGGREPGVENVFILNKLLAFAGLRLSFRFGGRNVGISIFVIPGRNPVSPPELAGDAPGLNVFHPVVIGLFPVLRDEFGLALFHRGDGRLGHRLGVDIPLVRHPRFDDDV